MSLATTTAAPTVAPMTKAQVRKLFRDQGYKISLRANPFKAELLSLSFTALGMREPVAVGGGSVYSADFYEQHRPAFEAYKQVRGMTLADTGEKIA